MLLCVTKHQAHTLDVNSCLKALSISALFNHCAGCFRILIGDFE